MKDLTGFQRDVLWLLAGTGETHGLGIKDKYESAYDTEIVVGRLYPNLDKLAEKGLIVKSNGSDGRTNSYRISQRGIRELRDRLDWEEEQLQASVRVSSQPQEN